MIKYLAVAVAATLSLSAAEAAPTIVNLSAAGNGTANGGTYTQGQGGPAANVKTLSFGAGTYTVSLAGIAGGGLYDAYTVADPASGNWTEQFAGFTANGVVTTYQDLGRYATAAAALTAYQAAAPLTFTLTQTSNVSFYIEDAAYPFFGDDTGGVSFAVNEVSGAVPEPATWAMMIVGFGTVGAAMRRRPRSTVSYA